MTSKSTNPTENSTVMVTGTHRLADMFNMASDEEHAMLVESVRESGLYSPIVVTPEGLILDGRNRYKACLEAGVAPRLEVRAGTEEDYRKFVAEVNVLGRRSSMTTGAAAASMALVLGPDMRVNGRWKRGVVNGQLSVSDSGLAKALQRCGRILDVLGPLALEKIKAGDSVNYWDKRAKVRGLFNRAAQQCKPDSPALADVLTDKRLVAYLEALLTEEAHLNKWEEQRFGFLLEFAPEVLLQELADSPENPRFESAWQKLCADNSAKNSPLMMEVQRRYVATYIKSDACTWSVRDSASAQWAAGHYFDVDADELRLLHPNDLVNELERAGLEVV